MRVRPAQARKFAFQSVLAAVLSLGLWLAGVATASAQTATRYDPDIQMRQMDVRGQARRYGLYVPSTYRSGAPAPLIVALHGRFSSAKAFHALTGLTDLAERRGAILVYPEPLSRTWDDGGQSALQRRDPPGDDLSFLAALNAEIGKTHPVNPARTFLIGYDTGGVMAFRAACKGRFAGAVVVSALMWDFSRAECAGGANATPMLLLHGTRDESYPVSGSEARQPQPASRLSAADTVAALRSVNGCAGSAQTGRDGSAYYSNCTGAPLAFVGIGRGTNDWYRDAEGYRLNRLGVDATRLADQFLFERAAFQLPSGSRSGSTRAWFVYAPPSYDPSKPTPVVVLLHGRPSNATYMAALSRMNDVADKKGFLVVYPEGVNNEWNAFYDLTRQRSLAPQDDIRFLKDLLADLGQDFNIDRRRAFVGGYSNGGFMTYRLACSMADTFAGFAAVDATLYTVLKDKCRGGTATPILIMNGTADPSVSYFGVTVEDQDGRESRVTLSVPETVAWFINRNDCSMVGATTNLPPKGNSPGTNVIRFEPKDCKKAPVMFWRVDGGGHTWPGVDTGFHDPAFGPTNMDINAGEVIWDFFEPLRLPTAPAD